jgi:predicted Zn-dependent protease
MIRVPSVQYVKYAEARTEFTALATAFPQNVEIQFQLANLDMAEKKYSPAEARFEQLYEKDKYRALSRLVET